MTHVGRPFTNHLPSLLTILLYFVYILAAASNTSSLRCGLGQCWYCLQCTGCCACAAGSYCPGDDYQYTCPRNTYNARTSSNSSAACVACPSGKISNSGSQVCSYMFSTVAGSGPSAGWPSDGVLAVGSYLNSPGNVRVDKAGTLYIADSNNHEVRYLDSRNGIISTYAGTGYGSFCSDGSYAVYACLNYPMDLAFDSSWNMYIADTYNYRIRMVTRSTMIIKTVAGTGNPGYNGDNIAATSAYLYSPSGIAIDASNNVYVSDMYNSRIRKIDAATQKIITVAGMGSCTFNQDGIAGTSAYLCYPRGIAFDLSGNLFISDAGNYRIRKLSKSTGIITTVAGKGYSATSADRLAGNKTAIGTVWYLAFDTSGAMYFGDMTYNVVRKLSSGIASIVAGVSSSTGSFGGAGGPVSAATLNQPSGVAVDIYNNVYIADNGNNVVREIIGM